MSEAYAGHGARVTGVDPSSGSLEVARSHARQSGLSIRYEQGRGEAIPSTDASFDLVSCCDVLEHVDDLDAVIREIARVLRPGGLFFFDTINRTWPSWLFVIEVFQEWLRLVPPGGHDWEMFITPRELGAALARAGLEMRNLTGLGPSFAPLALGRALLHWATGRMDHDDALALSAPRTSIPWFTWGGQPVRGEAGERSVGEDIHGRPMVLETGTAEPSTRSRVSVPSWHENDRRAGHRAPSLQTCSAMGVTV